MGLRRIAVLVCSLALPSFAIAAEGMWTFDRLPLPEMQAAYGFAPAPEWVAHVQRAAVLLRGNCSGAFVSSSGLVATNQHCVRDCLGQLSSAGHDLLASGFYAASTADEQRCQATELDRLDGITDVTARMSAATRQLQGDARVAAATAAQAGIESECAGTDLEQTWCQVVRLYGGMVYDLYRYHRYQDVRVVFAPEDAIAKFGGDPDNFNFPRYNFDVALLRAYENGKPAPITDFLPFAPAGAAEGEMTLVVGNPAETKRASTISELETLRDDTLIMRIGTFSELRGTLTRYGREGDEQRRAAQDDLYYFENSLKATKGEQASLADPTAFEARRRQEADLRRFVQATPALAAADGDAWDRIARAEVVRRRTAQPYRMLEHGNAFFTRYFDLARFIVRGAVERLKPNAERLPEFTDAAISAGLADLLSTAPIDPHYEQMMLEFSLSKYRELVGVDDPLVRQIFATESPVALAAHLVGGTKLGDVGVREALWDGGVEAIRRSDDPFIRLALQVDAASRDVRRVVERDVDAAEADGAARIAAARFAMGGGASYPDATFTLRLSYGDVAGWDENGEHVSPFTDVTGLYRRAAPYEPLKVPQRWLDARPRLSGARHFNLATSNDVTGGNSGSPVINRHGEIVGVMFDGNRHALGNAYWYDGHTSRAISVDSGLVLEALEQVYGATRVVEELKAARH